MSRLCYARPRCPSEVIRHAVWLSFRVALGYRDVEDMRAGPGIDVSYETVRQSAPPSGAMTRCSGLAPTGIRRVTVQRAVSTTAISSSPALLT